MEGKRRVRAGVSAGPEVPQWEQLGKAKERWFKSEMLGLELVMWAQRVMGQQLWIILYLPGATCLLEAQEILESRKCPEAAQLARTAVTGRATRWQHQPDEASASSGGPPSGQALIA